MSFLFYLPFLVSQVNDDLLVKIASRRQNVTEINISDCRGVHDHGVSSLASQCPGLQKYTAYRCKQLGDISLSALATHCPLLVKIHVGNQDKLTDGALKKVNWQTQEFKRALRLSLTTSPFIYFFLPSAGRALQRAEGHPLGSVLWYLR